ncbi:SH3 beta-barrel fold-containing protein [Spirosoma aerophilum]
MKVQSNTPIKVSRADVLRLTWQLVREASLSFSQALKKAWATIRLKAEMLIRPVSFFYLKDDGTERFAVGHYSSATLSSINSKPTSTLVVRYFDTLANGWRSFRIDRLILA